MAMPAIRRRWTAPEVRALMDETRAWPRYELIDGDLIVTPAPGTLHQIAVTELWAALSPYVDAEGVGVTLISPADLELEEGKITQPDVFVAAPARGPHHGQPFTWGDVRSLLVALEVISPSSIRSDRVTKRKFYVRVGVPEYWVADLDARTIERWTPRRKTPAVLRSALEWQAPGAAAPLVLDLPDLFDRIWSKWHRLRGGR